VKEVAFAGIDQVTVMLFGGLGPLQRLAVTVGTEMVNRHSGGLLCRGDNVRIPDMDNGLENIRRRFGFLIETFGDPFVGVENIHDSGLRQGSIPRTAVLRRDCSGSCRSAVTAIAATTAACTE